MEDFPAGTDLRESFEAFEKSAALGHADSIWLVSLLQEAPVLEQEALKALLGASDRPLGWHLAGRLSDFNSQEMFDLTYRSAQGGCGWGQVALAQYYQYGRGGFVPASEEHYLRWLQTAAAMGNPFALFWLGYWHSTERVGQHLHRTWLYHQQAAALGFKSSMRCLAQMARLGEGCAEDPVQAVQWAARGLFDPLFFSLLTQTRQELATGKSNMDRMCQALGWGLYWYLYKEYRWNNASAQEQEFGNQCLDYYCANAELQQESIWTFLLCWNRAMTVKEVGVMIAKLVWEGREENLVKSFD
jgi:TPR repeat protein